MADLVIKASWKSKIKVLLLSIVMVLVLGHGIKSELDNIKNPNPKSTLRTQRRGRTALIVYVVSFPIFGLVLILMIVLFFKRHPVATITNKGILFKQGLISWGEVDYLKIGKIKNSTQKMVFIVIEVKDEKKLKEELDRGYSSKILRKILRLFADNSRRLTGFSPFSIIVSETTMSAEFVLAEMQKRLDTYRENVKEPNKLM